MKTRTGLKMKGQVPMIELISVTIILLISMQIFFPGFSYQNRWNDAVLFLKGRDMVLTLDRSNLLYEYSFNPNLLGTFVNNIITDKNLISWSEIQGTVKKKITVACNCTVQQTGDIIEWVGRLKLNNRSIDVDAVQTNLETIQDSDVLVIWGREDLEPYKKNLLNYLTAGNGIIEIINLRDANFDSVQREIFGIENCKRLFSKCQKSEGDPTFIVPGRASQINYDAYKIFYHLPTPLKATELALGIPTENNLPACPTTSNAGSFNFRENSYKFWVCGNLIYFDTDKNGKADITRNEGETFTINNQNFVLSYVDPVKIYVSFRPVYSFRKFTPADDAVVYPVDKNMERVLLAAGAAGSGDETSLQPFVIVNKSTGRTAWLTDSISGTLGDDYKLLFASVILSTANKKSKELTFGNVKIGFLTSYINTASRDMFEVYQFDLGLGFPF